MDSAASAPQRSSATASSEGPAEPEPAPAPTPKTDMEACMQCVQSEAGCAAEHQACSDMGSCAPFYECSLEKSCFAPGQDPTPCLAPCAIENGLTSETDPVITTGFLPLVQCTATKCIAECTPR